MIIQIVVLLTFNFLLFTFPVYAQAPDIGQSSIHPASPLYFLKSVRETLELKFTKTTHTRALRQLEFSTRRIREVNSLVETGREDLIWPTLERYVSHLQELKGLVNLQDEDMSARVSRGITAQMDALLAVSQKVSDVSAKRSLRTTIYRLSEYEQLIIDKLNSFNKYPHAKKLAASKLQACNFLSQEASGSALNEVERVVLAGRAQKCLTQGR